MNIQLARTALEKYFGYTSFRPLQAEVIQSIYDQKDVILLMPTGGGKSICFQIPAITMEGTCIVVSPLISLMKDQVESLKANGIRAAFLNSSQSFEEQRRIENELYGNKLDLLYTSPEKMASQNFLPMLKSCKISFFAIDEAHCISSWGHDFRPEYRQLRFLKKSFPEKSIIAVTATADKITRKDMAVELGIPEATKYIASFDRPNLSLEARPGQKRIEQIIQYIQERPNQSGIIYCLAKKSCESLAGKLLAQGIKADYYHAGLSNVERSKVQEDFINDRTPIICATIAFGMGIDKSNVRWVIHYNLPKNIEGFYQEIGRAGRDGTSASTLLFYSSRDLMTLRDFIQQGDAQNSAIHRAKLDRMYQYATSLICRRKILLNYFNETCLEDCGNCDICKNPPTYLNGTVLAQKALSAVARLKERVPKGVLVDVLRGSKSQKILSSGYDQIKTYGAGKDIRAQDWFFYLEQLINQGFLEIAYDDFNKVKLTDASKEVLFNQLTVQLIQPETQNRRKAAAEAKSKGSRLKRGQRNRVRDGLFEHLRKTRLEIAKEKGVPPYIVFSDATLEEMAAEQPKNLNELSKISGLGEVKLREYGTIFLASIEDYQAFRADQQESTLNIKKPTFNNAYKNWTKEEEEQLLAAYHKGLYPEELASIFGRKPGTIAARLKNILKKESDF